MLCLRTVHSLLQAMRSCTLHAGEHKGTSHCAMTAGQCAFCMVCYELLRYAAAHKLATWTEAKSCAVLRACYWTQTCQWKYMSLLKPFFNWRPASCPLSV